MPRLVTTDFSGALPDGGRLLPSRPLGNTGLRVAYVRDLAQRVQYLTRPHLEELGIENDGELHELALANVRKIFDSDIVRSAVGGNLIACKALDTYDAARLLLVPENLKAGESLVAAVPDRDTLALIAMPRNRANEFPMTPDNTDHLLLNKPL